LSYKNKILQRNLEGTDLVLLIDQFNVITGQDRLVTLKQLDIKDLFSHADFASITAIVGVISILVVQFNLIAFSL